MQALFWWHMEKRRTENRERGTLSISCGFRSPFSVLRSYFAACRCRPLPIPLFALILHGVI